MDHILGQFTDLPPPVLKVISYPGYPVLKVISYPDYSFSGTTTEKRK